MMNRFFVPPGFIRTSATGDVPVRYCPACGEAEHGTAGCVPPLPPEPWEYTLYFYRGQKGSLR